MKQVSLVVSAAACLLLFGGASAFGGWVLTYPDTAVSPNSTIDYNVYGEWDLELVQVTLPTVVRELDPGSFWTGALPVDTPGAPTVGIQWNWVNVGWAGIVQAFRVGLPDIDWCPAEGDVGYDGVSPDHFVINVQGALTNEAAAPSGRDFITLTFDVTAEPGQFEIDTACWILQLRTIYMVDESYEDHGCYGDGLCDVVFNKGTITIAFLPDPVADTVYIDLTSVERQGPDDSALVVPIYMVHDEELSGFEIPILYLDPSDYWLADSVEFLGGWNSAPIKGMTVTQNSYPTPSELLLWASFGDAGTVDPVVPNDLLAKIHFKKPDLMAPRPFESVDADTFSVGFDPGKYLRLTLPSGGEISPVGLRQGSSIPTDVVDITTEESGIPNEFALSQNYPNPFNAATVIEFAIREPAKVKLEVFNILGAKVVTLADEYMEAGLKRATWDGKNSKGRTVASGMYFYRLIAGDFAEMKKMVLLK